jgi:hypothetical protein
VSPLFFSVLAQFYGYYDPFYKSCRRDAKLPLIRGATSARKSVSSKVLRFGLECDPVRLNLTMDWPGLHLVYYRAQSAIGKIWRFLSCRYLFEFVIGRAGRQLGLDCDRTGERVACFEP